jgi:hypothetical protein
LIHNVNSSGGTAAPVTQAVATEALDRFDEVFTNRINAVYWRNPLRSLPLQMMRFHRSVD